MFLTAFSLNSHNFIAGFTGSEIIFPLTAVILIRVVVLTFSSLYLFKKWFSQEEQYLTDIPFLIGLFFYMLIYGKAMDLFFFYAYESPNFETLEILLVLKIRFLIIVFNTIPLLYLGLGIYLFAKLELKKNTTNEKINKYRKNLLIGYTSAFSFLIVIGPSIQFIQIFLGVVATLSVFTIAWMFTFAYRQKRLSQINPLLVSIGFTAWSISSVLRPVINLLYPSVQDIVQISFEMIDLLLYILIFVGFITPAKYGKQTILQKKKIDEIETTPTSTITS